MTALSKATLKATWIANFKPLQADFANMIDSWTDYYASLDALGAAVAGGATGFPFFSGPSTVNLTPQEPYVRVYSDTPTAQSQTNTQYFYAVTSSVRQGIYSRVIGSDIIVNTVNGLFMETYAATAALFFPPTLYFRTARGLPSSPDVTPANAHTGLIAFDVRTSSAFRSVAGIRGITLAAATAAGAPVSMDFSVDAGGINFGANGIQFRIQRGHAIFEPQASAPTSPSTGSVYFDSGTGKLRCYDGTSWHDLF